MYVFLRLIPGVLLLLLVSCRPEPLVIDIPQPDPQVVLFNLSVPEQTLFISLTRTLGALDFSEEERGDTLSNEAAQNLLVSGADVTITYQGQTKTLEEVNPGSGVYASFDTELIPAERYTLDVVTPDNEVLQATTTALPIVAFTELVPFFDVMGGDTIVNIRYSIDDPAEKNWYLLNFYLINQEMDQGEPNSPENPLDVFSSNNRRALRTLILDDILFEDQSFEATTDLFGVSTTDSLAVTLTNISEEYYRFVEAQQTGDNVISILTREPINTPSNITNGLGIFNVHFPSVELIDINDY